MIEEYRCVECSVGIIAVECDTSDEEWAHCDECGAEMRAGDARRLAKVSEDAE